jgi:ribonuclease T2
MLRVPLSAGARAAAFLFTLALIVPWPSLAQDKKAGSPGQFDFYVLALSWSPSFCAARQERPGRHRSDPQCGARPFGFVVHGLWPQFEHGFPSYCEVPAPRLARSLIDNMLDLMPSRGLIYHEWDRHGTCSGLSPQAYFDTVRKAYAAVKIPPDYRSLAKPATVTPGAVAAAFVKANPGLSLADMAVGCDRKRLTEVRLCLTTDFRFHACPQIARRSCRRNSVVMPAVRGG